MSAEVSNALEQRAHQLDAEADKGDGEPRAHPSLLKFLASEYRHLSLMVQGKDPAAEEAARQAAEQTGPGGDGLTVERTDEATGEPVPPPPDAAQPVAPDAVQPAPAPPGMP